MSNTELLTYNGYRFNEYSEITVNAVMTEDESERTVVYHRYTVRAETTIYAEELDVEGQAGQHFERLLSRLTKAGQALQIHHEGFGVNFELNNKTTGKKDVRFGPKPKIVNWTPTGHANAVDVVWECEFCVSTCQRTTGLMAFNYSISTRIDSGGYTTRTITGYLEIAMTRLQGGRSIPDTADNYRDALIIDHLPNFQREIHWHLSLDKRRNDFTVVDTEIRGTNPYPMDVIRIRASHSVGWTRRQAATLPQTIRATIELAEGVPKAKAWEIFRAIFGKRVSFAQRGAVFIESLQAEEELYDSNVMQFVLNYRFFMEPNESALTALSGVFTATGLGTPVVFNEWIDWKNSIANPYQSNYGIAQLKHEADKDQIIDLCAYEFLPATADTARVRYSPPRREMKLYNASKPPPRKSYLRYETTLSTDEEVPSTVQITVSPDDLNVEGNSFNPNNPDSTLGKKIGSNLKRFVETQGGSIEIVYTGYAERVGYPIPRPDKININGLTLQRKGKSKFAQVFKGNVMGQPVYAAAWNQRYIVSERPQRMDGIDDWGSD